jgi:hypothetical protein
MQLAGRRSTARSVRACLAAIRLQRCAPLFALALLAACGGGGSSSSSSTWSIGSLGPWRTLAAQCQAPRSGTDPFTGQPYPDRQGTLLNEQDWLASWTNDTYLWYQDVSFPNPDTYATAIDYFDVLKTPLSTPSGKPKDRFHFTYPTSVWEALSSSGVQLGYGATWDVIASLPPRQVVVAYTEPNAPATQLLTPLARGATVLSVDGYSIDDPTQAGVNALNAGLFPTDGSSHTFVVLDVGATLSRSITMAPVNVTDVPVQNVGVLSGTTVGYLLFNDQLATAEGGLYNAITTLKSDNITDLVIDMRYNGGGYLDIASELAYMVAGPGVTSGKTFDDTQFNAKYPTVDPIQLAPIAPTPFVATTLGLDPSVSSGTALPHLDLPRVFVLTGTETCSASEAVMNGLRGVGVTVYQIGSTTCGKPYGFYPQDNCGTTYFSIQFQGVNQAGFGNYPDGFVPQNGATGGIDPQAVLPGCSVADDFTKALGDPTEGRLAAALQLIANGVSSANCPAATGFSAAPNLRQSLARAEGRLFKDPFRSNRILRHPAR